MGLSRAMIQAAVTMNQLQHKLDVVGNNLANSQTTGFKTRDAQFASLLYQQINNNTSPKNAEGRLTPDGVRVGTGARLGSVNINLTPGIIQETDRALDNALLEKNHLFQIQVEKNGVMETQYTRDGAFYLSPTNDNQSLMLTMQDGSPVIGENGPIQFSGDIDDIVIKENGQIVITEGNETETVDSLAIVEAVQPRMLETTGENQYRLDAGDELEFEANDIIQQVPNASEVLQNSALEQSNVDLSKQMSDLINAQRSYQFNARTISVGDEMQGLINQLR